MQRTKELQEEEEKVKGAEIFRLNELIENMKKQLIDTEEKAKVKRHSIKTIFIGELLSFCIVFLIKFWYSSFCLTQA